MHSEPRESDSTPAVTRKGTHALSPPGEPEPPEPGPAEFGPPEPGPGEFGPPGPGPGEFGLPEPGPAGFGPPGPGPAGPASGVPGESGPELMVIVGAAIVAGRRVLACERSEPAEMRGMWEFPGGKVDPGETEPEALVRECEEELGVRIEVGERVGEDVLLSHGRAVLKVYAARLVGDATPHPHEHSDLRWLAAGELHTVPWLPADAPIVAALPPLLR